MIKIKSNKIILADRLFDGFIYIEDGKIINVTTDDLACSEFYDFTNSYVSAGFIDLHTHGGGGYAFLTNDSEEVVNACNFHLKNGTTSIMPTLSVDSFEVMKNSVKSISLAKKSPNLLSNIIGVHLEGPYLSLEQSGAQCPEYITPPIESDYVSLIEEFGSDIARWTYAPENDKDGKFAKYLNSKGVLISIGHSSAKDAHIEKAIENGANLITHLYSCTSTITRDHGFRSLGIIEMAYLKDELYVEIIADGKHLPLDLIKLIVKIKGIDKVALITDSLEIAGTDIKEGKMGGTEFIVEDGICKLKDRSAFAGSVATSNLLIKTLLQCGYSIVDSVKMLTEIPAKIAKLNKGTIEIGKDADIIVFDDDISVSNVFVNGIKIKQ